MITYLKKRAFYAKIQAELKGQYADQAFVNRVCQTEKAQFAILEELFPDQDIITGPKEMRYFTVAAEILSQRLIYEDVSAEDLEVCAALLYQRMQQVRTNPHILATMPNVIAGWDQRLRDYRARAPNEGKA